MAELGYNIHDWQVILGRPLLATKLQVSELKMKTLNQNKKKLEEIQKWYCSIVITVAAVIVERVNRFPDGSEYCTGTI